MDSISFSNYESKRVEEVRKYFSDTNSEADLNFLCEMAAGICNTSSAFISFIADDNQYITASHGEKLDKKKYLRKSTFCTQIIENKESFLLIEDALERASFKKQLFFQSKQPVKFYVGVPIINEAGFSLGSLCAIDSESVQLSALQIEKLKMLARQVMKSLELARKSFELENLMENLTQERKKYQYFTTGTETATFEWEIKNNHLNFNKTWKKITGYKQDDFKLNGIEYWKNLVHPDDIGMVMKQLNDHFLERDGKFSCEYRFKHQNGKWIWILSKGKVFERDNSNKPVVMYGLHQDVSLQKEKEFEILYRQKLLDTLYHLSPLGIALNDYETGAFLEVNAKLLEPSGYTKNEFINLSYWDLTPKEYTKSESEQLKKLDTIGFYGPYEKEYIRKDGSRYPVLLKGILTYDAKGNKRIWSFIEDISERKVEENLKEEKIDRIEKLLNITENQNERLKNFAHIVSHNLRSHSSGITLLLEFLKDSHPTIISDESFKHLQNASNNLETTIQDLNEVVEVNLSGQQNFHSVNLKAIISRMVESVYPQLESENVKIETNIENNIEVYGLRAYVESIILNFITNAIKYKSPKRESYLKIKAKKVPKQNSVTIIFEDNGLGIDLNLHSDRIFKMYKTFHEHKDARGIGLFLTKNQIEAMDGKIEVESKVDYGTKFTVELPYEKN